MEVNYIWSDQIPEKDGEKLPVNDVAFSPDGVRVIAGVGNRVLLYRASDGELIDSLRGHKDNVYCVSYSSDGTRFASGGADNVVIIWKHTGQGLLKYNHTASIQQVKFNPATLLLASCSEVDFGLWSPSQKQVTKEKIPSRILSAAWSSDGSLLALGMLSGLVSIRSQQGEEIMKIERSGPVWCLAFVPEQGGAPKAASKGGEPTLAALEHADNLAIGCWDRTYSLYRLAGPKSAVILAEKTLSYYPCALTCANNTYMKSCYLVMTGSNQQVTVLSRDGVKLADVLIKPADSWIWSNAVFVEDNIVAYSTNSGSVHCVQLNYDNVHTLYIDKFAYRENLTEVIIQHLLIDKKVRIKCKDMIHNVYLYKNKLAVQLFDRICIYECSADDSNMDMHFKLNKQKIMLSPMGQNVQTKMVSNLLCVTSQHVLVAIGGLLELYSYEGTRQKIYTMEAKITCLKVDGGLEGREGVYIALSNGSVYKVFVDNAFPMLITKNANATASIVKLDVNVYKTLLATIDTEHTLCISDLTTQEVIYSLNNVQAVCFNSEVEDLLCISNHPSLSISIVSGLMAKSGASNSDFSEYRVPTYSNKSSHIDIIEQHIVGSVLAYKGAKVYTISKNSLICTDIPQGQYINKALDSNNYLLAYKIACLGATESEWRVLALKALRNNQTDIAKQAFSRLKDTKYLNMIDSLQQQFNNSANTNATNSNNSSASRTSNNTAASDSVIGRRNRGAQGNNNNASNTSSLSLPAPSAPHPSLPAKGLDPSLQAEILCYEGHYLEAAKMHMRNHKPNEAIRIFTDLKRYQEAKAFAQSLPEAPSLVPQLTSQQAKWLQESKEWRKAAELFSSMGQHAQAAQIVGENVGAKGWEEVLVEVARSCSVEDKETLLSCGEKLSALEDIAYAREVFLKAQDYSRLMSLLVKRERWSEAAQLAEEHRGGFDLSIFLSYAEWLVKEEKYLEAMQAFKRCNRGDLGRRVLRELAEGGVEECRFKDAAYYYYTLAKEVEAEVGVLGEYLDGKEEKGTAEGVPKIVRDMPRERVAEYVNNLLRVQAEYEHKADLYYAYSTIHSYVTDPFTSFQPEMLFQVSRFIINSLGVGESLPLGISKTSTLYTLAKQAMALGAFKLARSAFERLQKLNLGAKYSEIELDMLLVQAKPMRDEADTLPVCYRCGSTNPLLNPFNNKYAKGDVCTNCGHPFVRSFINFDILPLVEFLPPQSISDEEAVDLIRQNPSKIRRDPGSLGHMEGGANVLSLNDESKGEVSFYDEGAGGGGDLFTQCINLTLEKQKHSYTPVVVDASCLLQMKRSEVFVCRPATSSKRATFYKNMLPELPIAISQACHRFFHLEDFEFAYLSQKHCPYSRVKNVGEYGSL